MKIALFGYGKMGKAIEEVALKEGHQIVAIINDAYDDLKDVNAADICFEFTNPSSAIKNIQIITSLQKDCVIGTTGWYDEMPQVKMLIEKSGIGALYAPNFSIGLYLFQKILQCALKEIDHFDQYDIGGVEYHHNEKKDIPSGTAKALARQIEQGVDRIEEFQFISIRKGNIPGTHKIFFDGPDTIEIKHTARDRLGFAEGTLQAAEWVHGKKGLFTFEQMMEEIACK